MLANPVRRLAYQPLNQSHDIPSFRVSYLVCTEARYLEECRSIHDDAGDTSPDRRSDFTLSIPDVQHLPCLHDLQPSCEKSSTSEVKISTFVTSNHVKEGAGRIFGFQLYDDSVTASIMKVPHLTARRNDLIIFGNHLWVVDVSTSPKDCEGLLPSLAFTVTNVKSVCFIRIVAQEFDRADPCLGLSGMTNIRMIRTKMKLWLSIFDSHERWYGTYIIWKPSGTRLVSSESGYLVTVLTSPSDTRMAVVDEGQEIFEPILTKLEDARMQRSEEILQAVEMPAKLTTISKAITLPLALWETSSDPQTGITAEMIPVPTPAMTLAQSIQLAFCAATWRDDPRRPHKHPSTMLFLLPILSETAPPLKRQLVAGD